MLRRMPAGSKGPSTSRPQPLEAATSRPTIRSSPSPRWVAV